jgi:hypothetical protein
LSLNEYILSGAIEACIFGVATSEEEATYQNMRLQHPEVVAYANNVETAMEQQMLTNAPLQPSAKVKDDVMQSILNKKQTPVVPINSNTKKSNILQYAVAACIAITLGSIVFNLMMASKLKQQQAVINKYKIEKEGNSLDFLKNPEITPVALNGVGYHAICRCSLFWDKNKNEAFIQIHHLVPLGENSTYQLWAVVNGKTVSVGLFTYNPEKKPIIIKNIPAEATEFIVTVENKSGATIPNADVFLRGIVGA